jgi:hypothetical protein
VIKSRKMRQERNSEGVKEVERFVQAFHGETVRKEAS